MFKKILRPVKLSKRKTQDKEKLRLDIKIGNAKKYTVNDAFQANRYFQLLANKRGVTNTDMLVEVMRVFYKSTNEAPLTEKQLVKNLTKKIK